MDDTNKNVEKARTTHSDMVDSAIDALRAMNRRPVISAPQTPPVPLYHYK